jgi:light-regulated signal transduction histidine kinase (bacteriophytochrome)
MGSSQSQGVGAAPDLEALQRQIEQLNQELASRQEELQQLVFGVSHDAREPLRQVIANTEDLESRLSARLDDASRSKLAGTKAAVQRVQDMLSALQAYAEAGEARPEFFGPVEASTAVDLALLNLEPLIHRTRAEIVRGPLPCVIGRDSQLTLLFQHLIDNGIRYCNHESPRIRVSSERRGDDWVFAVEDNGEGIDARYHSSAFVLFKRLHSRDKSGAGIGLAVCRRIVQCHGGNIWVESEPGRGSTFFFSLPARDCPSSPSQTAS